MSKKYPKRLWSWQPSRRPVLVDWLFEPRDIWVGLYIQEPYLSGQYYWQIVYLALLPTLPIRIKWRIVE